MTTRVQLPLFDPPRPSPETIEATAAEIDGPWTATVTAPAKFISANHQEHWAVRARLVKAWRAAGLHAAQAANLPVDLARVHIAVTAHMAKRSRLKDVLNLSPTVKAAIDGMVVDYGLCADDSDRHLEGTDLRAGAKETDPAEPGRLVFTITRRDTTLRRRTRKASTR